MLINHRYDVALGINTLGAAYALNFAKRCAKVKVFVHVSTGIYIYTKLTKNSFFFFK